MNHEKQNIPINILLADDDIDDCAFFKGALQEIPLATKLSIVGDGEKLMDHLNKNLNHLPDVLFLDLSMPRKTGYECLSEIKENTKLKDLPVVVFTTSFTRGVELELKLTETLSAMGASQYVSKPAGFAQLKQVLHKALIDVMKRHTERVISK